MIAMASTNTSKRDPRTYYDELYSDYEKHWSKDHMHYGFWDEGIKTHEESLINTVKTVTDALEIKDGMKVLDAGCGVGGASRYVVNHYNVSVNGITYSDLLLKKAREYSKSYDKSILKFQFMDYTKTDFKDEAFDCIFGLESVCYANDKHDFIKEAYRILKPGGKLVVADGFQIKDNLNEHEEKILDEFCQGWALPNLASVDYFQEGLEKNNFKNISYIDKTPLVLKSSKLMYDHIKYLMIPCYIASKLHLIKKSYYDDCVGVIRQKEIIDDGIAGSGMFVATKN